jgi:hypothetical protein
MAVGATVISTSAVFGHNPIVDVFAFAVHSVVEAGRRAYIAHKYAIISSLILHNFLPHVIGTTNFSTL